MTRQHPASEMLPHLPASRKAVVQDAHGQPKLQAVPMPALRPGEVLVQTLAVGLNPSDYKMGTFCPVPGAVVGNDFAGVVVAVADATDTDTDTDLRPGDLVYGGSNGSNPDDPELGAFTTYVRAPAAFTKRLGPSASPSSSSSSATAAVASQTALSIEQGATLTTAIATATLALWADDALALFPFTPLAPAPAPAKPVLVYGGSTASGTILIQLLRLSGFDPIATCSPRNFALVRDAGASAVFDYADPTTPAAIRQHTQGRLKHVVDCIADAQSVEVCFAAMARYGGTYVSLELVPDEMLARRRAVRPALVMAYEIGGEGVTLPGGYGKAPDPAKKRLGAWSFAMCERLLHEGRLRPHPVQKVEGGLDSVCKGLTQLKSGGVSGAKLVVVL